MRQLDRIGARQQAGAMQPQPQPHHVTRHEAIVLPEWIDSNGHMNLAYYVVVFDHAGDGLFDYLDIGMPFRERSGYSSFVAETHTRYEREVKLGDRLCVFSHLLGADAKRLHVFLEMFHAEDGFRAATQEQMCLHINLAARRVAALPDDKVAQLRTVAARRGDTPPPPEVGRGIAMPAARSTAP
jgi:acyl-CoA thioester hydrolase